MEKGTSSALHSVRIYYENAPAAGSAGSEDAHGMTGETGCKITLGAPPLPSPPLTHDRRQIRGNARAALKQQERRGLPLEREASAARREHFWGRWCMI